MSNVNNGASITDRYAQDVIKAGDEASGNFLAACRRANEQTKTSNWFRQDIVTGGFLFPYQLDLGPGSYHGRGNIHATVESIDGVGTKTQIYSAAFEGCVRLYENGKISDDELLEKSVDIWERMISDLIAMNTDDLRRGEVAASITNIIDINHLKGVRGKVFADSMAIALANIITENDLMVVAGETAVLGEPRSTKRVKESAVRAFEDIISALDQDSGIEADTRARINDIMDSHEKRVDVILKEVEFNIGGTTLGIIGEHEKLIDLKPGQFIVGFQEKDKDGIIGPRSNGITAIRDHLTELAGEGWENLEFKDFLARIGEEKASKISDEVKRDCEGKRMWEIATGKTTVFNPFVSRTLLGGVIGKPLVEASSLIHVTGNPGHKIANGLEGVGVELDISDMQIPQIIQILQATCDISDEQAMSGWNMGVPYAIVCATSEDAQRTIDLAKKDGITAQIIGRTIIEQDGVKGTIDGVGIGDSTVTL